MMDDEMMIPKTKRLVSKKIQRSAKGERCTVNILGICNNNPETTILAHFGGAGMGQKCHDIHAFYACSDCHTYVDGGYTQSPRISRSTVDLLKFRAMLETQDILISKNLIKAK